MEATKTKEEPRVFKNNFLDFFTLTSPALVFWYYAAISGGILAFDYLYNGQEIWLIVTLFFSGLLFWSFAEYWLHRHLFHMFEHSKNPVLKKAHFFLHGYHHTHPKDSKRMFMPLPLSTLLALGFLGLYVLILGEYGWSFMPGFIMGYVGYSLIHYYLHIKNWKNGYWQGLLRHHNLHHFKYNEKAFGISSTLWDHVFFTMPPKESRKPRERTVVK